MRAFVDWLLRQDEPPDPQRYQVLWQDHLFFQAVRRPWLEAQAEKAEVQYRGESLARLKTVNQKRRLRSSKN